MSAPKRINLFVKAWIAALAKALANDPILCREARLEKFVRYKDVRSVRYVRTLYNERFDMNHPNETFAGYKSGARDPREGMRNKVAAIYKDVDNILEYGLPDSFLLQSMLPGSPYFAAGNIKKTSEDLSVFDLSECHLLNQIFSGEMDSEYYAEKALLFYESPAKYTLPKRVLPIIIACAPESALNVLAMAVSLHMLDRNQDGAQYYGQAGDSYSDIYELSEFVETRPFVSPHVPLLTRILKGQSVVKALQDWNLDPADILRNCHIPDISPESLLQLDRVFPAMTDKELDGFLQQLSWIQAKEIGDAS